LFGDYLSVFGRIPQFISGNISQYSIKHGRLRRLHGDLYFTSFAMGTVFRAIAMVSSGYKPTQDIHRRHYKLLSTFGKLCLLIVCCRLHYGG